MYRWMRICVICVTIMFFGGLVIFLEWDGVDYLHSAEDYQMTLHVEADSQEVTIEGWKNAEGVLYYFLPAYVDEDCRVVFSGLGKDDYFCLGEIQCDRKTNIIDNIVWGSFQQMTICVDGRQHVEKVVFMKSENIGSVFLDLDEDALDDLHSDKSHEEGGNLVILDENGELEVESRLDYIRCRGNSTFTNYEKKAYQIKLPTETAIMGMEPAKKWILLANAHDDSLIRNEVIFDYGRKYTDIPTAEGYFFDVYINSQYMGNYYLCEKMEVGDGRVDITVSNDITGGYLLERISQVEYENEENVFATQRDMYYRILSPKNANMEQVEYICGVINDMEHAIYQEDGINPETGKHFSEYIDIDSWVDKYLVEEVFHDPDAPAASMFLYKDSDSVDSRIQCGPLWDYDRALGGYAVDEEYYLDRPKQYAYRGLYAGELLRYESVNTLLRDRFINVTMPYVVEEMAYRVYSLQQELRASAAMDDARWPRTEGYYSDYKVNGEYIINFAKQKVEYLDALWCEEEKYHIVTFLDFYGNMCEQYTVEHGGYLERFPKLKSSEAIFSRWVCVASEKTLDLRMPVLEDKTYRSEWIDAGTLVANGLAIADMEIEQVDVDTMEVFIEEIKRLKAEKEEQNDR